MVLVLAAACLPGQARGEELQIPKCEEAWCFTVAQSPSAWPAAYTGKTGKWANLLESKERLGPADYAWTDDVPESKVAIPGSA